MDDIREVYSGYCGGLIDPSIIDANLTKCTISISKRGQIRYKEFIEIISKKQLDAQKQRVRKCFNQYDEKRLNNNRSRYDYVKPALLYKTEVKKMIGAIAKSNNNQSENYLSDFDKDQDDYLTIDETMGLVVMLATAQSSNWAKARNFEGVTIKSFISLFIEGVLTNSLYIFTNKLSSLVALLVKSDSPNAKELLH